MSMLDGKTVLITGGTGGIGAAIAELLAKEGARLVLNYHKNHERAYLVLTNIKEKTRNENVLIFKADVTDVSDVKKMVEFTESQFGVVDILINNAACVVNRKEFLMLELDDFNMEFEAIFKGSLNCSKLILPKMVERKSGKIINILTTFVFGVPPNMISAYICAKYALLGLTKVLASEYGPRGITVNAISPGLTETEFNKDLPDMLKQITARQTPLRRIGMPEDMARVTLFLCSEESNYLTGVNIPVCGGNVM